MTEPVARRRQALVAYHCDECGPVDAVRGDHGQPLCPDCERTVEQVAIDGGPWTPEACPHCDYGGAFNPMGPFTRETASRTLDGEGKVELWQRWSRFRCPGCGNEFAMLDREVKTTFDKVGEEPKDYREVATDGGETLPAPGPGWYAINGPHQDPARVISGPHDTAEEASRVASIPSGNSAIMHTPALVNAVKNEGYNVTWLDGVEKPDALQDSEVATDGGVPVMSGDVVDAERRDDGTIVATVEFDTEGVPDALPVMDWLTAGDVHLSIAPEDGGHVLTDGGHPPGPSASEVHPDAVFMGTATHKCDGCGGTFEEIEELAEHDCRPLAGVVLEVRDVLARTGGEGQ